MLFNKESVYFGSIKKVVQFESTRSSTTIKGEVEYNGEKEIFIKVKGYYVPVREIKTLLQNFLIRKLSRTENFDYETLQKQFRNIVLPSEEFSMYELPAILILNNYRYVANPQPIFENDKGKISLSELRDLRIKYKYTKTELTEKNNDC